MNRKRITSMLSITGALLLAAASAGPALATPQDCQLDYPIVLSHHFGVRAICPGSWSLAQCEQREGANIEKYCEQWDSASGCSRWILPPEEENLPPRKHNLYDSNLARTDNIYRYQRYFSKSVVDRLEACGNDVFIADKPPYASYQVRAKSLRNTVLDALDQTGAARVVLMGHSQGAQDARFMTAALPVDDNDPGKGMMVDHVAGVVTLAGEWDGAESATVFLNTAYTTNYLFGSGWGDYEAGELGWSLEGGEAQSDDVLWRDSNGATSDEALEQRPLVLYEDYHASDPNEYDLAIDNKYRNFFHAMAQLSRRYMNEHAVFDYFAWNDLRSYLDMSENSWQDLVNAGNENCNGVEYFSYAAKIRQWNSAEWDEGALYYLLLATYGANDGYVTVRSQRLDKIGYPDCQGQSGNNFRHVQTLDGSFWGRGYHHLFFTGRNANQGPAPGYQEPAPYSGDAADVYEQIARDLRAAGL